MQKPTPTEQQKKTPASDMQAEDAGTADSGNDEAAGQSQATPSEKAMKQTSKTDRERSPKR